MLGIRLENPLDHKRFLEDSLEGIWIYKPLCGFRPKRVRIISDPERFRLDFLEKQRLNMNRTKENQPLQLMELFSKQKAISAGNVNGASIPQKARKPVPASLIDRPTLLHNFKNLRKISTNPIKLPAIQRASSIKRGSQVQILPVLKPPACEEEEKEYVFRYKYLSPKAILQRYLDRPLLIDGRKCELR